MNFPTAVNYTDDHQRVQLKDDPANTGIAKFAQQFEKLLTFS